MAAPTPRVPSDSMVDSDGQGRCPVDFTLKMIGGKWKPLILHLLSDGTLRFGQLLRAIPQITQRVLTLQLRELERDGLVERSVFAEIPPRVEYSLRAPARDLLPILAALGEWMKANRDHVGVDLQGVEADAVEARPGVDV